MLSHFVGDNMIRNVIAIWACHFWTRAFGYKDKLPWSNYKLDLEILDDVLSQASHIVASKALKTSLPKSFLAKYPNIIECNSQDTLDKVLIRLTGTIVVLGGRTVFQFGIDNGLFDHIIENQLFFPRHKVLEYDTVAPKINQQKYKFFQKRHATNNKDEGIYINYWEKIR